MRLEEIASSQVRTLQATDSVEKAFALMVEHDIRHLPIMDEAGLAGIVSDRDLLITVCWIAAWKSLAKGPTDVGKKPVTELMSSPVSMLSPDDSVERAAELMVEKRFGAVPLERDGKIVGIVTETDVLRCYLDESGSRSTRLWQQAKVADHMSEVVLTAKPSDDVMSAFNLMREKRIRHLPVVDEGKMVGLVSDRDLRRTHGREIVVNLTMANLEQGTAYRSKLEETMSRRIETIDRFASLAHAASRMVSCKIGALPVIERDELIGIITETDLLMAFVSAAD